MQMSGCSASGNGESFGVWSPLSFPNEWCIVANGSVTPNDDLIEVISVCCAHPPPPHTNTHTHLKWVSIRVNLMEFYCILWGANYAPQTTFKCFCFVSQIQITQKNQLIWREYSFTILHRMRHIRRRTQQFYGKNIANYTKTKTQEITAAVPEPHVYNIQLFTIH